MKTSLMVIILSVSLAACSRGPETRIKNQVIAIAEEYVRGKLSDPERSVSENGVITIGDTLKRYVIDPSMIYTGLIDDDRKIDAIVSVQAFDGQYETTSDQLVILGSGNGFSLAAALESDMRIISVKDRIITADVPEHSRNTPLFHCPSCWEVVKFRFEKGELKKIEE